MIRVENLVKNYGDVRAVRDISFKVNDGEILGFLGENGAGKSTTLKVMTGYLSATAGNVFVDDMNIVDDSLEIRRRVGYLPELNPLYGEMIVYDLLSFIAKIRRMEGRAFRQALERVVEQCGLAGVVHRAVQECSKGYKQRIGLATAMLHDPDILILDEPVTGLDPNQIVEIRELIRSLGRQMTLIMSSLILQEIEATVDRIIIIHNGEIVADGLREELMSSFRGQTQLTLEVKEAEEESVQGLPEQLQGVSLSDVAGNNGSTTLVLEYDRNTDPRERIFHYARDNGWVILEMSQARVQLEDVFRNLTGEGASNA
ncbi:MAG: ATP-binding cassette domain-containing protein [Candidatus Latescibacteria bacterium]|nr:ATP-binding cassette domain-containing protein [Candidatus Latescibacterota bacterium]